MHPKDHLQKEYSRCNRNGQCCYGFPQAIQEAATLDRRGRVHLRRHEEEDRWVVPFIPFISSFMNCHAMCDICFTVGIFMYLYKYLFKDFDRGSFRITSSNKPSNTGTASTTSTSTVASAVPRQGSLREQSQLSQLQVASEGKIELSF